MFRFLFDTNLASIPWTNTCPKSPLVGKRKLIHFQKQNDLYFRIGLVSQKPLI